MDESSSTFVDERIRKMPTGYADLPNHILLNIFNHITENDLSRVGLVCKNWRQVSSSPELWKTFRATRDMSETYIRERIQKFTKLKSLFLISVEDVVIEDVAKNLTNLTSLTIRHSTPSEEVLCLVVANCRQLQRLDIKGCKFTSSVFFHDLAKLPNLKAVNVGDNYHMNLYHLFTICTKCTDLEELHLIGFNPGKETFEDMDCRFIFTYLLHLKRIYLDALDLTDYTFRTICDIGDLEGFGYYCAENLTANALMSLGPRMARMKVLKIREACQLLSTDLISFFSTNKSPNLEELDLMCADLTNQCLKIIVANCPLLKKLILRSCKRITDLAQLLKALKHLEMLNVAFCDQLLLNFERPSTLRILFLGNDDGSLKFARELQMSHQDLLIRICISEDNKKWKPFKSDKVDDYR